MVWPKTEEEEEGVGGALEAGCGEEDRMVAAAAAAASLSLSSVLGLTSMVGGGGVCGGASLPLLYEGGAPMMTGEPGGSEAEVEASPQLRVPFLVLSEKVRLGRFPCCCCCCCCCCSCWMCGCW